MKTGKPRRVPLARVGAGVGVISKKYFNLYILRKENKALAFKGSQKNLNIAISIFFVWQKYRASLTQGHGGVLLEL